MGLVHRDIRCPECGRWLFTCVGVTAGQHETRCRRCKLWVCYDAAADTTQSWPLPGRDARPQCQDATDSSAAHAARQ